VPNCRLLGFNVHADGGNTGVPFLDSQSTSSYTSDMSDYIETLSLSSHSSSDTNNENQRWVTTCGQRTRGHNTKLVDRFCLLNVVLFSVASVVRDRAGSVGRPKPRWNRVPVRNTIKSDCFWKATQRWTTRQRFYYLSNTPHLPVPTVVYTRTCTRHIRRTREIVHAARSP